jgi:hypothetical protein
VATGGIACFITGAAMDLYCIPWIFLSRPTLTSDVVPHIVSERCGVALIKEQFHKFPPPGTAKHLGQLRNVASLDIGDHRRQFKATFQLAWAMATPVSGLLRISQA